MSATTLRDRVVYSDAFAATVLGPVARRGYRRFLRSGVTSPSAYAAMRKLYGSADRSRFDGLAALAGAERPLLTLDPDPDGLAAGGVDDAVDALERDGYVVLGRRLDEDRCAELEQLARKVTCTLVGGAGPARAAVYDEVAPLAVRYDLDEADVVASWAAQSLIADRSLLAVAQAYLGAAPVQDLVTMWWSTAIERAASDSAAQLFHFDLDRLRFLKVFVFLTDVDEQTGPHVYVRGSHRTVPDRFRHDGRHGDDEVLPALGDDVVHITGPRGTVFLADTRGLHKGMALEHGHRLVFQTEYAVSLFGHPFTRPTIADPSPELAELARRHPAFLQRFTLPLPRSGSCATR